MTPLNRAYHLGQQAAIRNFEKYALSPGILRTLDEGAIRGGIGGLAGLTAGSLLGATTGHDLKDSLNMGSVGLTVGTLGGLGTLLPSLLKGGKGARAAVPAATAPAAMRVAAPAATAPAAMRVAAPVAAAPAPRRAKASVPKKESPSHSKTKPNTTKKNKTAALIK